MTEAKEIITDYLQHSENIKSVDVVILQEAEKRINDLFVMCNNLNLDLVVLSFDGDLRFIVRNKPSKFINGLDGLINFFIPLNCIDCDERHLINQLDTLKLKIQALNGLDDFIKSRIQANSQANIEDEVLHSTCEFSSLW